MNTLYVVWTRLKPNFHVLLRHWRSTTACLVSVKKLNPLFICSWKLWITFWWWTNLPAFWFLFCCRDLFSGLDHETLVKKNVIEYQLRETWLKKAGRNDLYWMCGFRKYPYPHHGGFFSSLSPPPHWIFRSRGLALLPPLPGISMIYLLGAPYPLEIPNKKKETSLILI